MNTSRGDSFVEHQHDDMIVFTTSDNLLVLFMDGIFTAAPNMFSQLFQVFAYKTHRCTFRRSTMTSLYMASSLETHCRLHLPLQSQWCIAGGEKICRLVWFNDIGLDFNLTLRICFNWYVSAENCNDTLLEWRCVECEQHHTKSRIETELHLVCGLQSRGLVSVVKSPTENRHACPQGYNCVSLWLNWLMMLKSQFQICNYLRRQILVYVPTI